MAGARNFEADVERRQISVGHGIVGRRACYCAGLIAGLVEPGSIRRIVLAREKVDACSEESYCG